MKTNGSFSYVGGNGGILEVLKIALPLIMASAGNALNLFTDRVMLTRYSEEAMSAAFPAGLTAFSLSCVFIGTAGYAGAFVAQYVGAENPRRVGVSVWQGIFMALAGGVVMAAGALFAKPLFDFFGHEAESLRPLEVKYFTILMLGTVIPLLNVAFSTFWGGRGRTAVIMTVNLFVTLSNIPFNYLFIFGNRFHLPLVGELVIPELGIAGAAIGTILAGLLGVLLYSALFFSRGNRETFGTLTQVWDWKLFCRLIRFGAPNGIQFFLDLAAFNAFIIILGRINQTVLAASGIAFALNSIAFIPMIGIGQTVSILVGQSIGAGNIPHAERSVRSARILILMYMACMATMFVIYPDPVLSLFRLQPGEVMDMTRRMLRFIAAYLLFDGMFILYGNAIKGAGDTRFAMIMGAGMAWCLFALPCIGAYALGASVWVLWYICVGYIMISGLVFYLRYRTGKWKTMRVIEAASGKGEGADGGASSAPCPEFPENPQGSCA